MPKLKKAFGDAGVEIEDQNGELRSTFDILQDLAGKWDTLSSKQKQYLGEKAAGTRQVKVLNAIMANWDVVEDTVQKASEATGEATEGNEKYLDSIQGRITQFKSAFQDLARTTIDSGFVKGLVGIGTTIVSITTNLGGLVPVLTTIGGLILTFKGAKIGESLAKALPQLANAFKIMKEGQSALTAFSTLLSTPAGVIGGIMAIVGIVTAIATAVSNSRESLAEQASKANQNYVNEKTALASVNSELENTRSLMSELEAKGSLTIIEQDQYNALKKTNDELERQKKVQEERTRIAEREAREASYKSYRANMEATSNGSFWHSRDNAPSAGLFETLGEDYFKSHTKSIDLSLPSSVPGAYLQSNEEQIQAYVDALPEQQKRLAKAQAAYDKLIDKGIVNPENELLKDAQENIDKWQGRVNESEDAINKALNEIDETIGDKSRIEKPRNDAERAWNGLFDLRETLNDTLVSGSDIRKGEESNYILNKYKEDVEELQEYIKESGKVTEDVLAKNFPDLTAAFMDKGWGMDEIVQHLNETFGYLQKFDFTSSLDSIIERNYLATDSYKNLTAAMTEQSKAGSISMETYQQLIQDTDLASYLTKTADALKLTGDGFALNTDLMYDYIKAKTEEQKLEALMGWDDRIKKLQELQAEQKKLEEAGKSTAENQIQQNAIQNEITALQAYIQELDSATGALARYKAAKSTANGDEDYTTGQSAYKDIVQGRKTGKVGTDDFKSAVDFVLGDDWRRNLSEFGGSVEKAYAEAQRLGKRYFGQKTDKAGGENFLKDVVKNGLGSFDKDGNFSFEEGATVEDIASKLKISEDAVKSLIKMLNTYAPEGEGFTLDGLIDDDDTAAIEKQRKAIEEETSNLDELKKKRNQMLKEDPNADTSEIDKTIGETQQRLSDLEEGAEVNIQTMSLEEAKDKIDELVRLIQQLSGDENIQINLDSSQLSSAEQIILNLCDEFPELKGYLEQQYGVEITAKDNTQEGIDKAKQSVNGDDVKQNDPIDVGAEDKTTEAVNSATESVNSIENPEKIVLDAEDNASSVFEKALSALEKLDKKYDEWVKKVSANAPEYDGPEPGPVVPPTEDQPKQDRRGEAPSTPSSSSGTLPGLESFDETFTFGAEVEVEEGSIADAKSAFEDALATEDAEIEPEVNGEGLAEKTQEALSNGEYVVEPEVKTPTPTPTPSPNPTPAPTPSPTKTSMEVDATVDDSEVQAYSPEDKNADVNFSPDFSKVTTAKVPDLKGKVRYTAVLPANAKGTTDAMKGPSLVDEEGPELIEHVKQGTYELGTNNGPRLTKLDKGDVVHTAEETKKILSRMGKIGGFFRNGLNQAKSVVGNAFATGVSGSISWNKITKTLNSVRNSSGGNKSSGKSAGWGYAQWIEKLFDWAEIRLDRLKTITNTWLLSAAEAIGYTARNKELTNAIKSVEEEIDNTNKAYQLYMDQASLVAQKAGLADDIIEKIKDGSIEIAEYDKTVQDKIKNYQEW